MRTLAVIPCRMSASRLPGKPLLVLDGRPLVQWVHDAVRSSEAYDDVVVATPDEEIATTVRGFGGDVVLTSADHETGTDRVAEVAAHVDHDIIANVQGDQPFVSTEALHALVEPFRADPAPLMTTVAMSLDVAMVDDPNTVKVVRDLQGDALYFSRSAIPFGAGATVDPLHHIGLYAFQRQFLGSFASMRRGPLEAAERLEQLRVLENGHRIRVAIARTSTIEINTPADVARAEEWTRHG